MKTRILVIAGVLIGFGLYQMYSIVPTAAKADLPFPFEHTRALRENERNAAYMTLYDSMYAAADDPFWIVWSLGFYSGIGLLTYGIIKKESRRLLVKTAPWLGMCTLGGFSLFLAYSAVLYYVYIPFFVDNVPHVEVKFDREIKPIYKAGSLLGTNVLIEGFGYERGYAEFLIVNGSGHTIWKKEAVPFGAPDMKHFSSGFGTADEPVAIGGVGKYSAIVTYENQTVFEKEFLVE